MEAFPSLSVKLQFNQSRGYHISLSPLTFEDVPEIFIQKVRSGKKVLCSTDLLVSLEERRKEAFVEIMNLTGQIIQSMLSRIRSHMGWMYRLSESISMIDMLCSFAKYVTVSDTCTRPIFGDTGPIAIRGGRHPIKSKLIGSKFICNDSFFNETQNMQIITGPNGSGKSTYLEQIGLIVVMGHIGCYVPASFARIRILESIFSKFSSIEEIGSNMGGFFKECKEMSFVLRNVTSKSLILIDEYGRGTSCLDGASLSWSLCEKLLESKPFVLFSTHFSEITSLAKLYLHQVKHLCFFANEDSAQKKLNFTFKLTDNEEAEEAQLKLDHYGISIASMSKFPNEVILEAEALSNRLMNLLKVKEFEEKSAKHCLLLDKLEVLSQMENSENDEEILDYLKQLQHLALGVDG
jgi:DNA mismatch repair protein MSH4